MTEMIFKPEKEPIVQVNLRELGLEGKGFDADIPEEKRRFYGSIAAETGHGKTHFGLTFPDPIAYIGIDMGHDGVLQKFVRGWDGRPPKTIAPLTFSWHKKQSQKEAQDTLKKIEIAWKAALDSPKIKTIVLDTESELWEIKRFAAFGRESNVKHMFTAVNAEYSVFWQQAKESDKHVVVLRRLGDEYVEVTDKDGNPVMDQKGNPVQRKSGSLVGKGWNHLEWEMFEVGTLVLEQVTTPEGLLIGSEHVLTFKKFRPNYLAVGQKLRGKMVGFDKINEMVRG
jgi:AAA domain